MDITNFSGEYEFLSNFYNVPVKYKYDFSNAEAAYQAQKALDSDDAEEFTKYNGGKAKRMARKLEVRPDWEEVKLACMSDIVFAKFFQNPEVAAKLLATGDAKLVEGNDWHDTFWGVDLATGEGQNNLGKILMKVREELKSPEISILSGEDISVTRFSFPEVTPFDWWPPRTTYRWSLPNRKEIDLEFERLYKIERKDSESFDGIEDFTWQFRGRTFTDLSFEDGDCIVMLYHDRDFAQMIMEHNDGVKFFRQVERIPTFDASDARWDGIKTFVVFRDEGGTHLINCRHGDEVSEVQIYAGLKTSVSLLEGIFEEIKKFE